MYRRQHWVAIPVGRQQQEERNNEKLKKQKLKKTHRS